MNHEEQARKNHRSGFNCAQSVFVAFAEELGVSPVEAMQMAPKPRDEGGKCGAYLAGQALLRRLKPEAAEAFEKAFVEANGVVECRRLVAAHGRLRKSCNDYVGDAARLLDGVL